MNVWNHKIIANSPKATSWVLIQRTLCHQNINTLRETIFKNNSSKIGIGKQLIWIRLLLFAWLRLWFAAIKSFETMRLKSRHHQRLQFQHTSENTRVRGESFICDKTEGFWHSLKGGKFSLSVSTAFKKLDSFHPETSAFTYNAARLRKFKCHHWNIAQQLLENDTATLIAKPIHTNVDDSMTMLTDVELGCDTCRNEI